MIKSAYLSLSTCAQYSRTNSSLRSEQVFSSNCPPDIRISQNVKPDPGSVLVAEVRPERLQQPFYSVED